MKTNILLLTLLVAALTGCTDETLISPQLMGKLKGTVVLYDTHGNRVADRSDVLIHPEGSIYSTRTDANGNWTFDNIPTQTYSLEFSKSGYTTIKNTSYSFVGGGTVIYPDTVYLSQLVPYTVVIDSVIAVYNDPPYNSYSQDLGYVRGHISGADLADTGSMVINVSIRTLPVTDRFDNSTIIGGFRIEKSSLSKDVSLTVEGSNMIFRAKNWQICGPNGWIQHGRKVYLQASAMNSKLMDQHGFQPYLDVNSAKWIDPDTGRLSNVVEVVIP